MSGYKFTIAAFHSHTFILIITDWLFSSLLGMFFSQLSFEIMLFMLLHCLLVPLYTKLLTSNFYRLYRYVCVTQKYSWIN